MWASGLSMNGGRCLRKKSLNHGIMSATIFTRVGTLTTDMIWNHLGYVLRSIIPPAFPSPTAFGY